MRDSIRDRWALVTGASSGLGADFARELAERGCHSVLVARREERLEALAAELHDQHGVETLAIPLDLVPADAPDRLRQRLLDEGVSIDVLINNAGFGSHGDFLDIPWERERAMIELDVLSLVHLTKLFVPRMVERGFGYILQVASLAAYQPVPSYASYGAAKAFVLNFGQALRHELRGTGVSCTVIAPGPTATEFQQVANHLDETAYIRSTMMKSRQVARVGVRAMLQGRDSVVPGLANRLSAWSTRLVPRRTAAALAERFMRKPR